MTWDNILKIKREDDERRVDRPPERRKRKVPMVGGKEPLQFKDVKEESLDDDSYEKELAEMTRDDLLDAFIDAIDELSQEELIEILVKTQGDIKLAPKF
tara:strand:- start:702 stop:998 length:297 start_codon:yes stop_codon:yes gene_type:complete